MHEIIIRWDPQSGAVELTASHDGEIANLGMLEYAKGLIQKRAATMDQKPKIEIATHLPKNDG